MTSVPSPPPSPPGLSVLGPDPSPVPVPDPPPVPVPDPPPVPVPGLDVGTIPSGGSDVGLMIVGFPMHSELY